MKYVHAFEEGSKEQKYLLGGKGANQAVAASYLGAEVHMVARVGSDLFGAATIKNFKTLGIRAAHVKIVKGASSGVAPNPSRCHASSTCESVGTCVP